MGTLWRALLEGFGWHVGREAAKETLDHLDRSLPPDSPPTRLDPKAFAAERKARAKAEARATKERAAAKRREDEALDAELRALKRRVGR